MSSLRRHSVRTLTAVLITVTFAISSHAQVAPPNSQVITSGMFGLSTTETARLNVVNAAVIQDPAITCFAELSFLNANGTVLKSATFAIAAGKAVLLDLDRKDVDSSTDRSPIRATVRTSVNLQLAPGVQPAAVSCSFVPTVEVFNKTDGGRTAFVLPEGTFIVSPTPFLPPGGPIMPIPTTPRGQEN
jgi:hypothetical protein